MENINFEIDSQPKYTILFKGINFFVAFISILSGATELFSRFDYFFQGLFVIGLGILIAYLEFRSPPLLFTYASSFFSFLGRGAIYLLLAVLNMHGSTMRWIAAAILFLLGILYIVLEFVDVQPPLNMQGNQGLGDDILDDII